MFAFSSLGVKVDDSINTGRGPYVFRINGLPSHRIGSLVPAPNKSPKFAQLYIYDTDNEIDYRMAVFDGEGGSGVEGGSRAAPDRDIVVSLTAMLDSCNALVRQFRMIRVSRERVELAGAPFRLRIVGSSSDDPRVYSPPTAPELAALIVGDLDADRCKFDIVVELEDGRLKRISPLHPALISLQYPLLFPYGDKGFHLGISYMGPEDASAGGRSEVSMLEYYAYRCCYRVRQFRIFVVGGFLSRHVLMLLHVLNRIGFLLSLKIRTSCVVRHTRGLLMLWDRGWPVAGVLVLRLFCLLVSLVLSGTWHKIIRMRWLFAVLMALLIYL
jgi:hypothetical protein